MAPAGSADWQNEFYIPKDLYEPIFRDDGSVNPANCWATYVYNTVNTYKPWVRVWHVWNEPDWTPDWRIMDGWWTAPPVAADLPRFNGSIQLPAAARGAPFAKDGKRRVVLWAVTPSGANTEVASASVGVTTAAGFDVYAWDGTGSTSHDGGGKVFLALTGSPVFLVDR
jgi:hypothetical protein